jgi:NAD(P)-dependent dehydrogenase (short-subunit alcohol dehydrogenase family)
MATALVTGGNRGIGRAVVIALARRGFHVAFVDLAENEDTQRTRQAVEETGAQATFIRGDLANLKGHEAIVERAWAIDRRLDVLVNNAGIPVPVRGDLLDVTADAFDAVLDVNLRGTFFLTQVAARHMLADSLPAPGRCIVTIGSISAVAASPERAAYCCSKAALSMMVKLFALRLAPHGIACHEVRPGIVRTQMTAGVAGRYDRLIEEGGVPIARWGEPEDIARAVAALCSGDFGYMTGEVLHIDGGLHIPRL